MKLWLIGILAIFLSGCAPGGIASIPPPAYSNPQANTSPINDTPITATIPVQTAPTPVPVLGTIKTENGTENITPPMYSPWLMPSKVTIGNFHEGGTAESHITFHNAVETQTDQKKVTTVDNDTEGDIPLNAAGLYLKNISSIISVTSSEPSDSLVVKSYDPINNTVLVSGFTPNKTRIITITYKPMTAYSVHVRPPDNSSVSASANIMLGWVTINQTTLLMSPLETANVTITITMPSGAKLPDKTVTLWVGVSPIGGGGSMAISWELISQWIINMKN